MKHFGCLRINRAAKSCLHQQPMMIDWQGKGGKHDNKAVSGKLDIQ